MSKRLDGRIAVVTGGAAGIGEGIVKRFIEEGAKVVIFDKQNAKATAQKLGAVAAYDMDVADRAAWETNLQKVVDEFGKLQILVNNAAHPGQLETPVAEYSPDIFELVIKTNLIGPFYGHRYGIPHMIKNGGGAIVNISAVASVRTALGLCAYNASKSGLDSLTRTAASEYGKQGIRVNSVRPGMVQTPLYERSMKDNPEGRQKIYDFTPLGRIGQPHEVAAAVAFLASDEASFITGAHLWADGGYLAS